MSSKANQYHQKRHNERKYKKADSSGNSSSGDSSSGHELSPDPENPGKFLSAPTSLRAASLQDELLAAGFLDDDASDAETELQELPFASKAGESEGEVSMAPSGPSESKDESASMTAQIDQDLPELRHVKDLQEQSKDPVKVALKREVIRLQNELVEAEKKFGESEEAVKKLKGWANKLLKEREELHNEVLREAEQHQKEKEKLQKDVRDAREARRRIMSESKKASAQLYELMPTEDKSRRDKGPKKQSNDGELPASTLTKDAFRSGKGPKEQADEEETRSGKLRDEMMKLNDHEFHRRELCDLGDFKSARDLLNEHGKLFDRRSELYKAMQAIGRWSDGDSADRPSRKQRRIVQEFSQFIREWTTVLRKTIGHNDPFPIFTAFNDKWGNLMHTSEKFGVTITQRLAAVQTAASFAYDRDSEKYFIALQEMHETMKDLREKLGNDFEDPTVTKVYDMIAVHESVRGVPGQV